MLIHSYFYHWLEQHLSLSHASERLMCPPGEPIQSLFSLTRVASVLALALIAANGALDTKVERLHWAVL